MRPTEGTPAGAGWTVRVETVGYKYDTEATELMRAGGTGTGG